MSYCREVAAAQSKLREVTSKAAKDVKDLEAFKAGEVFSLNWSEHSLANVSSVQSMPVVPDIPGTPDGFSTEAPFMWCLFDNTVARELRDNPKFQMTLGGFGGSFKKVQAYKDNHWYQQPVGAGKGVELVTEFISPSRLASRRLKICRRI